MLDTYAAARCATLFRRLAANGTVQVPTLAYWQRDRMSIAELAIDPRLRYIPVGERTTWEPYRARFDPSTAPLRRATRRRGCAWWAPCAGHGSTS